MEAFNTLLSDTREWRASLDGLSFQRIIEEEAARIELPFIEEEMFTALNDLNGDKAPRPDGFTIAFWQFSWEIVKVDIMRMFKDFFEIGSKHHVYSYGAEKKGGGGGGGGLGS